MTPATCEAPVLTLPVEVAPDWSPRHDSAFRPEFLNWLIRHPDEYWHATDLWISDDRWQRHVIRQVAHETVAAARRAGHDIDGEATGGGRGYCWRGCSIPRYKHRDDDEEPGPLPGQLTLPEAGGVGWEDHG